MKGMLPVLALLLAAPAPEASAIMHRVGMNQIRSEKARYAFDYHQNVLIRMQRGNGKLAREEMSDYTVTPAGRGVAKKLTAFHGKYEDRGKLIDYYQSGWKYKGLDVDGEVAHGVVDDFTNQRTRDGLSADLFPLTPFRQQRYIFHLEGRESYRGREVWRVRFEPDPKLKDNRPNWRGEALIDAAEDQPVLITTRMARGIPLAVRMLLGTNLRYLGFKVSYECFDGQWFPVSYGGEFEVRVLFGYKRKISLSMRNSDFRRADVSSEVSYGEVTEAR